MSARSDAWEQGRRRRAVLAAYLADGLGSWGCKAKLADDHPELVPAGRYANSRLNKEIAAIRREQGSSETAEVIATDTPEAEYLRSLRRQLRAVERTLDREATPALVEQAGKLTRLIAMAERVDVAILGPGGRPHKLTAIPATAPTPADPVAAPTPTPATRPDQAAGTTPVDMSQSAALARVQAAWPEIAAEMDRWYPNGQPAKEG